MIKLDAQFQVVDTSTFNGVTTKIVTDTLFVSNVRLDFTTGAMYVTVRSGSGVPFVDTLSPLEVCVNPDGTFISSDLVWQGFVASAPQVVAQLQATFDQFILASGTVTGKAI